MMKKVHLYLLLILVLGIGTAGANGLKIDGLVFPQILHDNWLLKGDTVKYCRFPVIYDLTFYLSEEGCIDSLIYTPTDRPEIIDGVLASIRNIDFSPAKYNDENIPFILPASLEFTLAGHRPNANFMLPGWPAGGSITEDLIYQSLQLNGLIPAAVRRIPPYYCVYPDSLNKGDYPFAVYRVDLDSIGNVDNVELINGTYPHLAELFFSVLLHSEYIPGSYNGESIPFSLYVTVRFFERINYPTLPWPPGAEGNGDFSYEFHRISVKPYPDSIVCPPMPTNLYMGGIIQDKIVPYDDSLVIDIRVDTLGNVSLTGYRNSAGAPAAGIAKKALKTLKYLPARDINGKKVPFAGRIGLIFKENSKNIRMVAEWLKN